MTDALPVDEGRRQAYLAALGIPLWSARMALPGALPAEPLDFVPWLADTAGAPAGGDREPGPDAGLVREPPGGDRVAAPAGQAPAAAAAPVTPPAAAPGREAGPARRPVTLPAPEAAAQAAAYVAPPDPAADMKAPRLGCRAWALAPGLSALIDQGDAPDLSGAEHRLLANIALALDAPEPPGAVGNLLRWPLNNTNPGLDHGPAAMRAWLAHALRLPPGRCLVFGAALAAHVRAARPDLELIAAPTLAELLAGGDAKRRFWQALHG